MGRVRSRRLKGGRATGLGGRWGALTRAVRELPPSWRYALVGGAVALLALLALLVLPPRVVLGVLCGGIGLGMLAWEVRGRRKAARRRARR